MKIFNELVSYLVNYNNDKFRKKLLNLKRNDMINVCRHINSHPYNKNFMITLLYLMAQYCNDIILFKKVIQYSDTYFTSYFINNNEHDNILYTNTIFGVLVSYNETNIINYFIEYDLIDIYDSYALINLVYMRKNYVTQPHDFMYIIKSLINKGYNINHKFKRINGDKISIFMLFCLKKDLYLLPEIYEYFIEKFKPNLNEKYNGLTTLMHIINKNNKNGLNDIINIFLNNGYDISIKSDNNKTVYDYYLEIKDINTIILDKLNPLNVINYMNLYISEECLICFKKYDNKYLNIKIFVPCGHSCCKICSEKIDNCHLCRNEICKKINLFINYT